MVDIPGLYFVIASGDQARFVRPGPDNQPHTIRHIDVDTLRTRGSDPGAAAERRAPAPGEWIILLSEHIINDFTMDLFSHLVVVAPAALLGELLAALDEPTRDSVLGTVEADLLNVPDQALWPHLCAWLPPIAGP